MDQISATPTATAPCHYTVEVKVPAAQVDSTYTTIVNNARGEAHTG